MFSTSLGLLFAHLGAYVILPLIPGILATWILTANRFRSWLFYTLSWLLGVGVLSYGLFLLQFVRFGVDRIAYAILVIFLLIILLIKLYATKLSWKKLIHTLAWGFAIRWWKWRSTLHKVVSVLLVLFVLAFLCVTFCYVTHLPSYGDDAFGNWHLPVMNILYDGGVKIFGATNEILGRGRLGYPIMIPTLQAFIAHVVGGYNDIYINMLQWLLVAVFTLFLWTYIYQKKHNLLHALLAPSLILSLPLLFLHTTQGYLDLPSAIYTSLAVIAFYEWLQNDGLNADLILGIALLSIASYIKNDGFVVYMAGTLIALVIYFLIHRKSATEKLKVFKKPALWIMLIAIILFFIAPFTFLKSYYHLGFNQAAGTDAGLGISGGIHWEIFPAIWKAIWTMNNYSVAPLLFFMMLVWMLTHRKHMKKQQSFLALAPLVILAIFIAVFLVTDNYKFVLDQTTVNRVFTMVLVIFFSSIALQFDAETD